MIFNRCYTGVGNINVARQRRTQLNGMFTFTYNGKGIDIVSEFKYLGTMFNEDVMCTDKKCNKLVQCRLYDSPRKFRVTQGRKCLAAWLRRCNTWMLNTDLMVTLFKTGAMPALEYGVGFGIWCRLMGGWMCTY